MENMGSIPYRDPIVQLDIAQLDIVELIVGGLLDYQGLDLENLPQWSQLPDAALADPGQRGHIKLADPDGTPLVRVSYTRQSGPGQASVTVGKVQKLADAEHGPFRELRLTSPLGPRAVVLFDQAPSAVDLQRLQQLQPLPNGTCFVLLSPSDRSSGPGHAEAIKQLRAAAGLFSGSTAGHLVVPPSVDAAALIQRLSGNVLADFRSARHQQPEAASGTVVMFSGLSGSGKSTLARAVQQRIHEQLGRPAVLLDGDDIRRFISKGLGFSREDRETNVERIGWIAARIAEVGGLALCAPIAPFAQTRQAVRELVAPHGRFLLVHVSTPLEVCEQRDRKGLYAKARAGEVKDFTGIDSPYEVPEDAELTLDLSVLDLHTATDRVFELLAAHTPEAVHVH